MEGIAPPISVYGWTIRTPMKTPRLEYSIQNENRELDRRFLGIVTKGGWRLLKRGESLDPNAAAEIAVVGVTAWDNLAMQSFTAMTAKADRPKGGITVFNLDDCTTTDQLNSFLPGVSGVLQTPVVAEYRDGQLVRKLEGKAAREWMEGK